MNSLDRHASLGQLWRAAPAYRGVFEYLGIVSGYDEQRSLTQVCQANGLDPETVARMLVAFQGAEPQRPAVTVELMALAELCDHIERAHHIGLRDELKNIDHLTRSVVEHHGGNDSRITKIRQAFVGFRQKILTHLRVEAEVLFPIFRQLETDTDRSPAAFRRVKLAMERMEREHYEIEEDFAHLCALTQTGAPMMSLPTAVRMLHGAVVRLERGINEHIYKEHQILFPRARAISRCHRL